VNRITKMLWIPMLLVLVFIPITPSQAQVISPNPEEEPLLVGRISHIEGQLMRYVPDQGDWFSTDKDAPFGINDTLRSDGDAKAEIIMPNNTWLRIDGDTQIQLIEIKDDVTEIDVVSGTVRFYNKGSDVSIKARTPFGYAEGPGGTIFDLFVGDDSAEVIALKGNVYFDHYTTQKKYKVISGSFSILADNGHVTTGGADTDPQWDAWNGERDALWAKRMDVKGASVRYLPPELYDHAYILDGHGRWESVCYDGANYYFWRPIHVSIGWSPFTVGRWWVWYGDHTWIPNEPFGYVTHHYGNWVLVNGFWYWAPPVARVRAHWGPPILDIGFAWYPGRVAWIHSGAHMGWIPLAPYEPYYCHRRWGRRAVVVKNAHQTNLYNINRYKHHKHAVIIDRNNLYKGNNYRNVRISNINKRFVKNNHVAPVVNKKVVRNNTNAGQGYNYTRVNQKQKISPAITNRIRQNHLNAKPSIHDKTSDKNRKSRQSVIDTRANRSVKEERINRPTVKSWPAPAGRTNKSVTSKVLDQQRQRVYPGYQETRRPVMIKRGQQLQARQPVQRKKNPQAEKERSIPDRTWEFSRPSPKRSVSPRSRFRSAGNRR